MIKLTAKTMQLTYQLQQKLLAAVNVSMRIEGYRANPSLQVQETVKALLEQQRVKVLASVLEQVDLQTIRL